MYEHDKDENGRQAKVEASLAAVLGSEDRAQAAMAAAQEARRQAAAALERQDRAWARQRRVTPRPGSVILYQTVSRQDGEWVKNPEHAMIVLAAYPGGVVRAVGTNDWEGQQYMARSLHGNPKHWHRACGYLYPDGAGRRCREFPAGRDGQCEAHRGDETGVLRAAVLAGMQAQDVTRAALASWLGVSTGHVSNVLAGKSESYSLLSRAAGYLGVSAPAGEGQ